MADDPITIHPNGEKEITDRLDRYMDDQDADNKSKAALNAIHEGLTQMGYEPSYRTAGDRWLGIVRGVGSVLGLTALFALGAGAFLPLFSQYGFGLAVSSIAFFAGGEIAERHGRAIVNWVQRVAANEAERWTASGSGD